MRKLTALLCFLLLFSSAGWCQKRGTARKIKAIMQEYKAVALAAAVVNDNQLVYVKSFGKKNLQSGGKRRPRDIFRIASISKSFSATSIMQLVEAGKLSLDDDMSKLMGFTVRNPRYPDIPITLRMCLSHTSSINDSQGYFTLDAINPAKNPKADSCYNDYAPGKGYSIATSISI
ncbi:MAG: serine hydrolase domain-containing protein [Flavihumibacter sp.]